MANNQGRIQGRGFGALSKNTFFSPMAKNFTLHTAACKPFCMRLKSLLGFVTGKMPLLYFSKHLLSPIVTVGTVYEPIGVASLGWTLPS